MHNFFSMPSHHDFQSGGRGKGGTPTDTGIEIYMSLNKYPQFSLSFSQHISKFNTSELIWIGFSWKLVKSSGNDNNMILTNQFLRQLISLFGITLVHS